MYNLQSSTGETQQAGIGKGEAQVFGNQDYMAREGRMSSYAQAEKMAQRKRSDDKQDDLLKSVASVGSAYIKPGDLPVFQKQIDELYKEAVNSFDSNGNISTANHLKLMQKANQLKMEAELSKNQREALEANMKVYNNKDFYDEEYGRMKELYNTAGNWGELPALKQKLDVTDYFRKTVAPLYGEQLKAGGYGTTYGGQTRTMPNGEKVRISTREEYVQSELGRNEELKRAAIYDFKNDNGGKVPTDAELSVYAQNKYKDLLPAYHTNPYPASAMNGGGQSQVKLTPINVTYNPSTGDLNADTGSKTEKPVEKEFIINGEAVRIFPPQLVIDPQTKEVIKGTYKTFLTPDDVVLNKMLAAENEQKKGDKEAALKQYEFVLDGGKRISTKPELKKGESQKEYQNRYSAWAAGLRAIENDPQYKPAKLKKAEVVETNDVDLLNELFAGTYGRLPKDIATGENRQGVNFMEINTPKKGGADAPLLSAKKLNEKKGTKYSIAELKKMFPNYNVVE
jgi:hypothetical protein